MSEPPANQPINFTRFADWCKHKDSISESARHTVEVLLKKAGTSDCNQADKVLSNFPELNFYEDQITDINPLLALTNLRSLNLNNNQITDITGLSALTNLTSLNLGCNQITDITGLSQLTNLTRLYLYNNPITDITSLSSYLIELDLRNNPITNITPLLGLMNLKFLYLEDNPITDITALSALINLTKLYLNNNQITDITALSALTNLTSLSLYNNPITDITALSGLTNLTRLYLENNLITDITGLSGLTNLTELSLYNNPITDITGLSGLTNLTELSLYNNPITDITGLSGLNNLTQLRLEYSQVTDITPLSALTNLTILYLCDNQITDITGLSQLTNLTQLYLENNPITHLNLSIELTQKCLTLSTTPIDSQKATETVKKIYAAIDREAPQVIVCSSWQAASLKLIKKTKISWISEHQKWEIATNNLVLGESYLDQLFHVKFAGDVLWDALWRDAIILEPHTDLILVSEFKKLVIKNHQKSLRSPFRFRSDSNYPMPLTPRHLLKEVHLTEFFMSKFGVTLDLKAQELLRCKQQVFEECGWIFPFEKFCIICDRPLHIRFDSANELHAEGEPAIAFADGYSLYFYHGVQLPEQYGKVHPDLWQAEWLLSESNAEIRRLLIERIGYDRICQQLQAVELDSWQEYTLLKIDNADVEPIYLLKMTCPSTGFIHALRVPPDVRSSSRASLTAKEAIRWVNWDIDSEEFSVQT
jgi:internalin A